jgi:hypothetical protein
MIDGKTLAAAMRNLARGLTDAALVLEGTPTADDETQRRVDLLREFDRPDGQGLTQAEASLACKRHGRVPLTVGAWARAGWVELRTDGLRYLTPTGRTRMAELG